MYLKYRLFQQEQKYRAKSALLSAVKSTAKHLWNCSILKMEINVKITAKKKMQYTIFFWQESENMEFCWLVLPFAKDLVLSFYLAT